MMPTDTFQIQCHSLIYVKLSDLCAGLPKALSEVEDWAEVSFGDAVHTLVKGTDILQWMESAHDDVQNILSDSRSRGWNECAGDCEDILAQLDTLEARIREHVDVGDLISMES